MHTEDAWASKSDEGRGKLRKCAGIRKRELIRTCPNGGTRHVEGMAHGLSHERTQGTETSYYLQKEKETSIPGVVASEMGIAQTVYVSAYAG